MGFLFDVHGLDSVVDGSDEVFFVGEGLIGEIMGFEVAPDDFDVVDFGCVSGQPLYAQPTGAGGLRGQGRLPAMDGAVFGHYDDGSLALAGFGAAVIIEFLQKRDDVGVAPRFGGGDDRLVIAPVRCAHHRDFIGLAVCPRTEVRAVLGLGLGKIGLGQGLAIVCKQQYDVTGCGQCLAQDELHSDAINPDCAMTALQPVPGQPEAKPHFCAAPSIAASAKC
jgi:hypothetical protein